MSIWQLSEHQITEYCRSRIKEIYGYYLCSTLTGDLKVDYSNVNMYLKRCFIYEVKKKVFTDFILRDILIKDILDIIGDYLMDIRIIFIEGLDDQPIERVLAFYIADGVLPLLHDCHAQSKALSDLLHVDQDQPEGLIQELRLLQLANLSQ